MDFKRFLLQLFFCTPAAAIYVLLGCWLFFSCTETPKKPDIPKLFTPVSSDVSGLHFTNEVLESVALNYYVYMDNYVGGGVAAADFNNDGLEDLFLVSNSHQSRLFLNKGGLLFEDITDQSGIAQVKGFQSGVAVADVNGDGYLDIYIARGGWEEERFANLLYINNGDLTFSEQAADRGLADPNRTIHATFFDYDNDGDLDVYDLNSPDFERKETEVRDIKDIKKDPKTMDAMGSDRLYQNDGKGFFKEVTKEAGIDPDLAFGLNPQVADINGDGWQDLYVCNDFRMPDFFYINNGDGTFTDKRNELLKHMSFNSMGGDIADINNDGLLDIFTLDMNPDDYIRFITTMGQTSTQLFREMVDKNYHHQYMHNMLQLNRGEKGFSEIANMAGVANTDWSWAILMADFDLDGYNDIFVTNGVFRDVIDRDANRKILQTARAAQRRPTPEDFLQYTKMIPQTPLQNYFFKNKGGLTFENVSKIWSDSMKTFSNGAVYADLDNDGDLDLVVNNLNKEVTLLRNNAIEQHKGNYLELAFEGIQKNVKGVGVVVRLSLDDGSQMIRQLINTRGFLSSVSNRMHFGLKPGQKIKSLEITWPDGKHQMIDPPAINQLHTIKYEATERKTDDAKKATPMFAKKNLDFKHEELFFDDYKLQVLLPHQLSQTGPAFAVADVNGDGIQDVYVGGAFQQAGALFLGALHDKYIHAEARAFVADKLFEDVGATFFDADGDGDDDLYVVSGSYEFKPMDPIFQDRLYLNDGTGHFTRDANAIPPIVDAGSVVKAADYDQDGDLDLFVGGRVVPGQYPQAPMSYLLQNDHGVFTDVTLEVSPVLSEIGMVTDAAWADLDGDKVPELIITGEWMGIEVFSVRGGKLSRDARYASLAKQTGWWNRIVVADINQDGTMDIIAGNLGLNNNFTASEKEPLHIYAADFDNNGTEDAFIVKYYHGKQVPVRGWGSAAQQLPYINNIFSSFNEYASQDINGIIGPAIQQALHYTATELRSGIFIQKGDEFVFTPFDNEAQMSPVNGIIYDDLDGDGIKDLLLAGNNYMTETKTTRHDAGVGCFLKGKGSAAFEWISNRETGLYLDKDVRDIRLANRHIFVVNNNDSLAYYRQEK